MNRSECEVHGGNGCPHKACKECQDDIISIIPANGWFAWFFDIEELRPEKIAVAGWALIRGSRLVKPLLVDGVYATDDPDWDDSVIVVFRDDEPDPSGMDWFKEEVQRRIIKAKAKAAAEKKASANKTATPL